MSDYQPEMPIRTHAKVITRLDRWINVGDINYKKDGGLFIRIYDDNGELSASMIRVQGWANVGNGNINRENIVTYSSVTLHQSHYDRAKKDMDPDVWKLLSDYEQALAAAEAEHMYKGGYDSTSEIETPFTKGVDYWVKFYKDVATGKYAGPLDTNYTIQKAFNEKEAARKGGK